MSPPELESVPEPVSVVVPVPEPVSPEVTVPSSPTATGWPSAPTTTPPVPVVPPAATTSPGASWEPQALSSSTVSATEAVASRERDRDTGPPRGRVTPSTTHGGRGDAGHENKF